MDMKSFISNSFEQTQKIAYDLAKTFVGGEVVLLDGDLAITGAELDKMSDDELNEKVEHIAVYARVSPENKIRIVKAWQRKGQGILNIIDSYWR